MNKNAVIALRDHLLWAQTQHAQTIEMLHLNPPNLRTSEVAVEEMNSVKTKVFDILPELIDALDQLKNMMSEPVPTKERGWWQLKGKVHSRSKVPYIFQNFVHRDK